MVTIEPLEPHARLFHVGPPKTGTTSLQQAAAALRPDLLAAGVRYPGHTRNHRLAVGAFLGRGIGWTESGGKVAPPSMRHWYELVGELEAESVRRTWFGHEYAAHATPEQIRAVADVLGPSLEVVITLRSFGHMLPSMWQEMLKGNGSRSTFEPWLRSIFRPRTDVHRRRRARHDHAAMVERWVGVLGTDRVRVVVLDRADHQFSFRAFEGLLALPHGLLTSRGLPPGLNRGLTVPEVELLRRLNAVTHENSVPWTNHERLVVQGAVARMLTHRPDAPALRLPDWAVPLANQTAEETAARIQATGVRIIGEVANLAEPVAVRDDVLDHRRVTDVPLETAVDALAGMLAATIGLEPDFGRVADRTARTVLLHIADDVRGIRAAGIGSVAKAVAVRATDGLQGLGYAGRGWLARRRPGQPSGSADYRWSSLSRPSAAGGDH